MKKLKLIIVFLCVTAVLFSQEGSSTDLSKQEKELAVLFDLMHDSRDVKEKSGYHIEIKNKLNEVLNLDGSFDYPFQRISKLGKIYAEDLSLRVYTWNVELEDGNHDFGCFIQRKDKNKVRVYQLSTPRSGAFKPDEYTALAADNWYGALYFRIIPFKVKKEVRYVVLGMSPYAELTRLRMIDVFDFNENEVVLGSPVFEKKDVLYSRIVFEHGFRYQMSLDYASETKRIIFDNLAPSHARYTGIFTEYGPDFSYNAFVLKKKLWEYEDDIDVRNPE